MVLQCRKKESALVSVRVRALWTVSQDGSGERAEIPGSTPSAQVSSSFAGIDSIKVTFYRQDSPQNSVPSFLAHISGLYYFPGKVVCSFPLKQLNNFSVCWSRRNVWLPLADALSLWS